MFVSVSTIPVLLGALAGPKGSPIKSSDPICVGGESARRVPDTWEGPRSVELSETVNRIPGYVRVVDPTQGCVLVHKSSRGI